MRRVLIPILLLLALAGLSAQHPAFDVASIREHAFVPGSVVGVRVYPGGRLTANAPIYLLITSAYRLLPSQLEFAPGVMDTRATFYDIEAKGDAGPVDMMLQQLLADRFKLRMHTEKKSLPVYALVVDKGGLKLPKAAARDCSTPSVCGWKKAGPASGMIGSSVRLDNISSVLSVFLDRSVVDKTGVTDAFDVNLPPFSRGTQLPGATADGAPVDLDAPSIFAVLGDVGLRLEPRNELLDVRVVDHVERPE